MEEQKGKHKPHRQKHSGPQAERKKNKTKVQEEQSAKQRNPKAFAVQSVNKTARAVRRSADIKEKKHHIPVVDRTPLEPPPIVVAIVGPPKVGKTTLVRCLVKNFTQQNLSAINGPITIVSGKKRRLTLLECNNDISSMIDVAKVADLVLLMVDASFGFEMETFEFLNIAQAHGFPKIMGVLTHLDGMKNNKTLTKTKKKLKHRFWKEVYQGAKLFYLSGMVHGEYMRREIHNLGRFISVMKFRPLIWRTSHSYILGDRMEDLTNPEKIRQSSNCDRDISLYGYVRGTPLKLGSSVHLAGCGDFEVKDISFLPDPCPLPDKEKKRSLDSRERLIYAPMSGVGGIVYDKDVVYVELGTNKPKEAVPEDKTPTNELVTNLIGAQQTLDSKMATSQMTLFEGASPVTAGDVEEDDNRGYNEEAVEVDGRRRRRVKFEDEDDDGSGGDEESSSDEAEDEGFEDEEEEEDTVASFGQKQDGTAGMSRNKRMKLDLSGVEFADSDDDLELESSLSRKKLSSSQRKTSLEEVEGASEHSEDESDDDNDDDDGDDDTDDDEEEEKWGGKGKDLGEISEIKQKDDRKRKTKVKKDDSEMKDFSSKELFQEKRKGGEKSLSSSDETSDEDDGSDQDEEEESSGDDFKDEDRRDKRLELRKGIKRTGKHGSKKVKEKINESEDQGVRTKKVEVTKEEGKRNSFKNEQKLLKGRKGDGDKLIDEEEFEESSEESEDEKEDDERMEEGEAAKDSDEPEENEEMDADEEESEDEGEEGHLKWKENLAEKAEAAFIRQQQNTPNLRKLVYGELAENVSDDETEELGGLLTVTRPSQDEEKRRRGADGLDSSSFPVKHLRDWDLEEVRELIADCFVTGNWEADEDAQARLEKDDELYGDFEDLETGEVHKAEEEKEDDDDDDGSEDGGGDEEDENIEDKKDGKPALSVQEQDKLERQKRMEKKRKAKLGLLEDEEEGPSFFDEWKEEMEQQARLNRAEFEDMDDTIRTQYEGFRPGMYVRVELSSVPCEFVTNFDPTCPMVLGGLQSNESSIGFVQIRLKKHRWYPKILKTRDPLIFSVGWRRFQTIPLYCIQDHNGRNRLLKYTPEHLHCIATIWGPITPQGTGILAVQSLGRDPGFRIAATGVILDLDKSINIVKKLKLTGIPFKVHKNTAFIKGMFNSTLEVAKFEGALIRTVSGIRGQIKKASKAPPGAFRASFEDKLLLSDIVFLRTWYQVQLPKFYNPVTTMLLPKERKDAWEGMKTVGQLRREKNIPVPVNEDSLYKPIHRKERKFNRLVIPRKLAKELPFKYRPKQSLKKDGLTIAGTRAVIREPHERKIAALMEELGVLYKNKERKEKEERQKKSRENKKQLKVDEEKLLTRQRKDKKEMFRLLGQMKKKKF
ncbi:Ribosome biogenesis protein BMS1-like [Holothuria leucospilota]|uniref:Ribosome biogenesis protein BMS1-like n=1 Tax=Holothuria leucospilota TaxID=206669 RepID=A0A9Q1BCD8_HOLLE|nr:Ribosome biogenesis protein BMS1-like [Holothuria leucospilota]